MKIDKELVMRSVVEVVEEDELEPLLQRGARVYCGYETSGPVHIGTMLTVQKLIDFQNAGLDVVVLFADLHTLMNKKGSLDWIEKMTEYWRHAFISLGLDPKKTTFVRGSEFQLSPEYLSDVLSLGSNITVKRATRSMQEIARDLEHAHVSQIIYPIMQVVDIKHLHVDIAYGGIEQRKIHMLAREELEKIGYKKPVCIHTPLLVSLRGPGEKMSSSNPETIISIHDAPDRIREKINKAYCPAGETENNPILDIFRFFLFAKNSNIVIKRPDKFGGTVAFSSYSELESAYAHGLHPKDLKNACAEYLTDYLRPVRDYFESHQDILSILKR